MGLPAWFEVRVLPANSRYCRVFEPLDAEFYLTFPSEIPLPIVEFELKSKIQIEEGWFRAAVYKDVLYLSPIVPDSY